MRDDLLSPSFDDGQIEITVRADGVSIDMTQEGLNRLIRLLLRLKMQAKRTGVNQHLHLEDYELLTTRSPPCVVGVFIQPDRKEAVERTQHRPGLRSRWVAWFHSLFRGLSSRFGPPGGRLSSHVIITPFAPAAPRFPTSIRRHSDGDIGLGNDFRNNRQHVLARYDRSTN